ncbi:MAG TPA: RNA polymerase sigma-70 factor [Flavisolibacter sp.]|nr:RNA polymerase sigma-70 factor [Flavisolibacter sp.]
MPFFSPSSFLTLCDGEDLFVFYIHAVNRFVNSKKSTIKDRQANFQYFVSAMGYTAVDEKELLQQVAEGNEAAFRELFYRYADALGSYVLRLTHSKTSAEEIVQDVFLKIWLNRESLPNIENFRVYLFVLSRNQTLNALRKSIREANQQKEWEKNQVIETEVNENVAEKADASQLEGLFTGAIRQLPQQQQKVWLLSRKEGLTHPQIATVLGLSRETVKKYIMHANQSITRFIRSRFSAPN